MKVLLIYPDLLEKRIHEEDVRVVPIGLYYMGALLIEHGHQVRILNGYGLGAEKDGLKQLFTAFRPDLIGFSILNANRWGGIEFARLAKQVDPHVRVVFGGVGATYLWHQLLNNFSIIDYIVLHEGEYTLLELLRCLEEGHLAKLSQINGLALRVKGKPYRTPPRAPISDLDQLPDPARYFNFQHVALTRGCPSRCTFCGSPEFWGRRVRSHSAEYFVRQLVRLHARGINHFFFCDDTFTFKKEAAIEVCRQIISQGLKISWVAISKVTAVDDSVLRWMRKAGCTQISYGVESGSPKIRKMLGKRFQDSQVERAFKLTTRYGILPRAYFIYGSPGETHTTISDTVELMQRIRPLSAIFYMLALFPGTALYDYHRQKSGLKDDIWLEPIEDILYFEIDTLLSKAAVIQFGQILRESFYRYLPKFTENLDLIDEEDFYPLHADFLSRLAMTFSHGDYSDNELIPHGVETALRLYRQALRYHPDQRAYLGLGTIYQKQRRFSDSIEILTQGVSHFPENQQLCICLGISLMQVGNYNAALIHFEKFPDAHEARQFIPICRNASASGPHQGMASSIPT